MAIYFEHAEWFRPLFAEFDRRRTTYVKIDAVSHSYDGARAEEKNKV